MNNTLTHYASFEAMKQASGSTTLTAAEKERLKAEAKQMAEMLQVLRVKKQNDKSRK